MLKSGFRTRARFTSTSYVTFSLGTLNLNLISLPGLPCVISSFQSSTGFLYTSFPSTSIRMSPGAMLLPLLAGMNFASLSAGPPIATWSTTTSSFSFCMNEMPHVTGAMCAITFLSGTSALGCALIGASNMGGGIVTQLGSTSSCVTSFRRMCTV